MIAFRIICWLAIITLGVAGLGWTVQQTPVSGPTALVADANTPQDMGTTTSQDTAGSGRRLLELTRGLDGFRMPCADCHRHLGSPTKDPTQRGQGPHKHVALNHGENIRCFNCHHPNSDKYGSFAAHDGSVISVETVEQLCGKCHGPHYRAWKHGAHGQRSGHWNPDLGPQVTAHCNECHDPHQPYFKSISTLPGPRSLRGSHPPDHPCRKEH